MKLKKSWTRRSEQRKVYNNATLQDPWMQKEFKVTLATKFNVIEEWLEEEKKKRNNRLDLHNVVE
ncbi:hypothetical protein DPMN_063185 [Dreissena polymorpha]|uniref:Uncharacterized protein n=1 Tax=Dreissena polymorpha TaxID=45954 RepID=A0A9D4HK02_DREPO|nr:hypothetical protein DPMN_063185 [Dreissena polymorpha]